jgi:hypothetical protein
MIKRGSRVDLIAYSRWPSKEKKAPFKRSNWLPCTWLDRSWETPEPCVRFTVGMLRQHEATRGP